MNKPLYEYGDKVEFLFNGEGELLEGFIEIIDSYGTFFQREQPSYDICVPSRNNCLYKHVPESDIRRKLVKESITRGILKYNEKADMYSVLYSRNGYELVLDNPSYTEIRLTGMDKWVSVAFAITEIPEERREDWMNIPVASLKEWVGKSVEIRYMPPYMMVCDLIYSHQDDSNMIYEVYKEDANVVLFDGGEVKWNPEDLVLRGAKHHVVSEYYNKRVYRWDMVKGVMRLCLGQIPEPKPETLDSIKEWKKRLEAKEKMIPEVKDEKKFVVDRIRRKEFPQRCLKRMIGYANYISRQVGTEILTPITEYGFEYIKLNVWHKVYYQPEWIIDAIVNEEK